MNEGSRYALYFIPPADSALYRFGSSVLGYDCYTGGTLTHPDELVRDARAWHSMVDEPRRYGFHATLKAPFHLSSACRHASRRAPDSALPSAELRRFRACDPMPSSMRSLRAASSTRRPMRPRIIALWSRSRATMLYRWQATTTPR
jgi:hypothetical protein